MRRREQTGADDQQQSKLLFRSVVSSIVAHIWMTEASEIAFAGQRLGDSIVDVSSDALKPMISQS